MIPTPERFRALARSSPWRWSTLRYVDARDRTVAADGEPVRIRLRRPNLARVERLDGTLLRVHREQPRTATPLSRGGRAGPVALPHASSLTVEVDEDGFVRQRPDRWSCSDDPMVGNYYDVALLDPVELADGNDGGPGATVEDLRVVDHHGRRAWEAVLRPTPVYSPRCPCCPLLISDTAEDPGFDPREHDPGFASPDAHRVRLDLDTGVCVANLQFGGSRDGAGHDLTIEAVDEDMEDELFPEPPRGRLRGWLGGR